MRRPLYLLISLLSSLLLVSPAPAAAGPWSDLAGEIDTQLHQALDLYRQGQAKAARSAVTRAYFGLFEDRRMEAAMRTQLGARYTYKVEKRFSRLRRIIRAGLPPQQLEEEIRALSRILTQDGEHLDAAGIPAAVFQPQGSPS